MVDLSGVREGVDSAEVGEVVVEVVAAWVVVAVKETLGEISWGTVTMPDLTSQLKPFTLLLGHV